MLSVQSLSKSFGSLKVADDITFDVQPGEALGIIGPNGAGKSTLFNLITGNIRPDAGQIILDGRDVTSAPPMVRAVAGIGRSFQIPQPFSHLSVYENLLVAARFGGALGRSEAQRLCMDTLADTGLSEVAGRRAGELSLLQRKRLELARAMATQPRLILLDEIAGGLTDAECGDLIRTIRGIHARGTAVVWIEHVLHALTAVVTRLMVLNFGQVLMIGEPAEVMDSPAVLEIYLGIEA